MSCLFDSLSYFIGENSNTIRDKICDYLNDNNPIMNGLDTNIILDIETNNYIIHMRNQNTWGGAIEIQVACNIWNLKIIVRNIRDSLHENSIEFVPIDTPISKTIIILWNGYHYEPLKFYIF